MGLRGDIPSFWASLTAKGSAVPRAIACSANKRFETILVVLEVLLLSPALVVEFMNRI